LGDAPHGVSWSGELTLERSDGCQPATCIGYQCRPLIIVWSPTVCISALRITQIKFKVGKHSLYADKFTRLFYLLIMLIKLVHTANDGLCFRCYRLRPHGRTVHFSLLLYIFWGQCRLVVNLYNRRGIIVLNHVIIRPLALATL